jgi:transcription antitermination factor NusG
MAWYVMRDLTRPNALQPAWKRLTELGYEIFTPTVTKVVSRKGAQVRIEAPAIHDLLFVNADRSALDPVVELTPTLQYRYVRGGGYQQAMIVDDAEMERFIRAVSSVDNPRYFTPSEITSAMIGRKVRIIGGALNGYEGSLLSIKGLRKRCLLIGLADMITAAVEVAPDLIEFI